MWRQTTPPPLPVWIGLMKQNSFLDFETIKFNQWREYKRVICARVHSLRAKNILDSIAILAVLLWKITCCTSNRSLFASRSADKGVLGGAGTAQYLLPSLRLLLQATLTHSFERPTLKRKNKQHEIKESDRSSVWRREYTEGRPTAEKLHNKWIYQVFLSSIYGHKLFLWFQFSGCSKVCELVQWAGEGYTLADLVSNNKANIYPRASLFKARISANPG